MKANGFPLILGLACASALLQACASSGNHPAPAAKAIQLHWTPVTQAVDDSDLTDLTGYRLTWQSVQGDASPSRRDLSPQVIQYALRLPNGTWRVTVSALSASRGESAPSNVIQVTP